MTGSEATDGLVVVGRSGSSATASSRQTMNKLILMLHESVGYDQASIAVATFAQHMAREAVHIEYQDGKTARVNGVGHGSITVLSAPQSVAAPKFTIPTTRTASATASTSVTSRRGKEAWTVTPPSLAPTPASASSDNAMDSSTLLFVALGFMLFVAVVVAMIAWYIHQDQRMVKGFADFSKLRSQKTHGFVEGNTEPDEFWMADDFQDFQYVLFLKGLYYIINWQSLRTSNCSGQRGLSSV